MVTDLVFAQTPVLIQSVPDPSRLKHLEIPCQLCKSEKNKKVEKFCNTKSKKAYNFATDFGGSESYSRYSCQSTIFSIHSRPKFSGIRDITILMGTKKSPPKNRVTKFEEHETFINFFNELFTVYKKTQGSLTPKMKQQILPNSCHGRFRLCLRILLKLLPLFLTLQLITWLNLKTLIPPSHVSKEKWSRFLGVFCMFQIITLL